MPSVTTALVLDAHSRAGLEALQSLGRHGVATDVATDHKDCLAFHSRYVRGKLEQPPAPSPRFDRWLSLVRATDYSLVVPSTEVGLLALRTLDPEDPVRRVAVLASNESLDIALDKERTRQLAARTGVRTPHTVVIARSDAIGDCESYPVVLKPIRSKILVGGRAITLSPCVARSPEERLAFLRRILPFVSVQQQEYVRGAGFGVELLFSHGDPLWSFAHERIHEYPLTGGGSSYRRSIPRLPELMEPAIELMTALHWHGAAMVEFKWDRESPPTLMEINPRLWGSLALGIDAGVDYPWALLCLAQGQKLPPQPEYKVYFYTRDLKSDLEWQSENLTADHSDPLLFTRPRLRSVVEMGRPLWGQESWDHFDWRDMGITRTILRGLLVRAGKRLLGQPAGRVRNAWRIRRARTRLRSLEVRREEIECVLFVCYGNICRSPLAEKLAESLISGKSFSSAGFHPEAGRRAPELIQNSASALGVSLEQHASRVIDSSMVAEAQLILAADAANMSEVEHRFPDAIPRTLPLGLFLSPPRAEIEDPYGLTEEETARIVEEIRAAILGLAAWLAATQTDGSC